MNLTARDMAYASILAALTFISGFISIPLGPVPITLQTLFVLLSGVLLTKQNALIAQGIHLVMKLFIGGFQSFLSPSFGFLFGFIAGAYVIALILEKRNFTAQNLVGSLLAGSIVIYLVGLPYMALILNVYLGSGLSLLQILQMGMLLFIPGDILKAILAFTIAIRLRGKVAILQSNK